MRTVSSFSRRQSHMSTKSRRRRGQALVEMALVLTLLLSIVMGIVEFGWLVTRTYAVGNATREGARYASLGRTTADIKTRVAQTGSSSFITPSNITLEYYESTTSRWLPMTDAGANNAVPTGYQTRVTVTIPHQPLTGFFPFLKRNITQFTVMRREL